MGEIGERNGRYGQRGGWTYRVLSEPAPLFDDHLTDQRSLRICRGRWTEWPMMFPAPGDVDWIDIAKSPADDTTEELLVDLERRHKALDEPALSRSAWEGKISASRMGECP